MLRALQPYLQCSSTTNSAHARAGKLRTARTASSRDVQDSQGAAEQAQRAVTLQLAAAALPDQAHSLVGLLGSLQHAAQLTQVAASTSPSGSSLARQGSATSVASQQGSAGATSACDSRQSAPAAESASALSIASLAADIRDMRAQQPGSWHVSDATTLPAQASTAQRSIPHAAAAAALLHLCSTHGSANPALATRLGQTLARAVLPQPLKGAKVGSHLKMRLQTPCVRTMPAVWLQGDAVLCCLPGPPPCTCCMQPGSFCPALHA